MANLLVEEACMASYHCIIFHNESDKVLREDPNCSIQLPLPPAIILHLPGEDGDHLAHAQAQLILVKTIIGEHNLTQVRTWQYSEGGVYSGT